MNSISDNDQMLVGILRKEGALTVAQIADAMGVTETAVRQRLNRLTGAGLITRHEEKLSRGRPVHKYSLTREGKRSGSHGTEDLAAAVWEEVRAIEDESIRASVIEGIARRLAAKLRSELDPQQSAAESSDRPDIVLKNRLQQIAAYFEERGIPVSVDSNPEAGSQDALPVLNLHGCPYPDLSEGDDLICKMERQLFAELTGCEVESHRCDRNDGSECCSFHLEAVGAISETPDDLR